MSCMNFSSRSLLALIWAFFLRRRRSIFLRLEEARPSLEPEAAAAAAEAVEAATSSPSEVPPPPDPEVPDESDEEPAELWEVVGEW